LMIEASSYTPKSSKCNVKAPWLAITSTKRTADVAASRDIWVRLREP
jgi:hypothetical protein